MDHDAPRSSFRIRDADHDDIPSICAVMPAAFGLMGGPAWADPDHVAQGLASCAAGLPAREKIKVAVDEAGVAVGASYSCLAFTPYEDTHQEIGVIHGIAVAPNYRRRGAAAALLAECEAYLGAEGARVSIAEVRPRAVGFFTSRGYQTAPGPALTVVVSTGQYVLQQSTTATSLMWRTLRADDTVVPHLHRTTGITTLTIDPSTPRSSSSQ